MRRRPGAHGEVRGGHTSDPGGGGGGAHAGGLVEEGLHGEQGERRGGPGEVVRGE